MALLLPTACTDAGAGGIYAPWEAETEVRGDTTIVRTIAGSVWGDTTRLVPEVEIGVLDGADPYLFGDIRGLEVDGEGRIYAADRQAAEVRVFSAGGEYLHSIGRRGAGPGEFSEPDLVRIRPDSHLVVRDQRNARYSIFTPEGEFVSSWPTEGGFLTSTPFFMDREGRVFHPTIRNRRAPIGSWQYGVVRYDTEGVVLDTLDVPTRNYEGHELWASSNGTTNRAVIPFTPREAWTMDGNGGFLFGINTSYSLERIRPDGSVLRVERVTDPVPVGTGERNRRRESVVETMRNVDANWRWEGSEIPQVKPPYENFLAGADGTVWVRRHTPAIEEENPDWDPERPDQPRTRWVEPPVFDVFDEEGRYLGPVLAPRGMQTWSTPVLTRSHIWAVVLNVDFGHPQIVRYRLAPRDGE